jgi:glycosyltransferase involved in cell wall biosynthesis
LTPPPTPQLSVLIASHNRSELLQRCLDSLCGQTAGPGAFEVIVADDGSPDGTAAMVEGFDAPFPLRLLRLEQGGKSAALNAAVGAADGAICLFLDDDIIAAPELVGEHIAAHRREPTTLGIGGITQQPIDADDWYAHAFAQGWNEHFEEKPLGRIGWIDCYGANFSAPTAALRQVGGFKSIPTAEDIEMGFRLERAGCTPMFLPRAHGVHDDQKSGRRMLEDQRRQGKTHVELAAEYPAMRSRLLPWNETVVPRELPLRRALIALRVPPRALASLGRLLPGDGRKMLWLHLVRRFAFWRSVRQSVSRREWKSTTR